LNDLIEFLQFLMQNYGVLVTPDASGQFCCQMCGVRAVFANQITHDAAQPCHILNPKVDL